MPGLLGSSEMLKMGYLGSRDASRCCEVQVPTLHHILSCSTICRAAIYNLHTPFLPNALQQSSEGARSHLVSEVDRALYRSPDRGSEGHSGEEAGEQRGRIQQTRGLFGQTSSWVLALP